MSVERDPFQSTSKFHVVEKAKEYESFRQLPKFQHVPYAVIHPSPKKVAKPSPPPCPDLSISASQAKLAIKRYQGKQLPEHLIRPPLDQISSPRKSQSSANSPTRSKSLKDKKLNKSHTKKIQSEKDKVKRAEMNMKELFSELKKQLDRNDDEYIFPNQKGNVKQAKEAVKDRRLLRHLYSQLTGSLAIEIRINKTDFFTFIKAFLKISEAEMSELFLYLCKKLGSSQTKIQDNLGQSDNKLKLSLKNKQLEKKDVKKTQLTQKSDADLRDSKVDLSIVDNLFDKWYKEEESLSGILNMKVIKQKNTEFRMKLDAWKKRTEERKRVQRRTFEHEKKLRQCFEKFRHDFNMEKERVIECILSYDKFTEEKAKYYKEEKIINNFLILLPESSQILEIKDPEKVLENQSKIFKSEMQILRDFVQVVKTECVLNSYFFSFYDIPDLIVKKRYQRKDYDIIIKLLNKTKKSYLLEKAKIIQDKPIHELELTDEDLIPLELLDQSLSQKEYKFEEKKSYILALIQDAKIESSKKISQLGVDTDKTKKIIENSVFIHYLNQRLELQHQLIFNYFYKNQLFYYHFCAGSPFFKTAREFEEQFIQCMNADKPNNKFFKEYKDKFTQEMLRFNGKSQGLSDATESISSISEDKTKIAQRAKSAMKQNNQQPAQQKQTKFQDDMNRVGSNQNLRDEEIDDAIATLNNNQYRKERRDSQGSSDSINMRDSAFDPMSRSRKNRNEQPLIQPIGIDPMIKLGKELGQIPLSPKDQYMEEEEEEMRLKEEEERKRRQNESPYREFYKDTQGHYFDPSKKFGIIEPNSLVYDNITTSYPLNLPTDYYSKYIQQALPAKDQGKWFIRPHHLETLTDHPLSVKDDVLNTRYYSHYSQKFGKKEDINEKEEALNVIEQHLEKLRKENQFLSMQKGMSIDQMDSVDEEVKKQAQQEFERILKDKTKVDAKKLIIEAYEGVLYDKRQREKEVLNSVRFKEYEKNRPPQDRWYELKTTEFSKELYRNRMALKPNDENRDYLQVLKDPFLY